ARHAVARAAWPVTETGAVPLAEALQCDRERIRAAAADAETAEGFAIRVVPDVPGGERIVDLATAEAALATLLHQYQGVAA
ncbi:MAG: glycosyl transferase family 2, partial [Sphingomonas sp.]